MYYQEKVIDGVLHYQTHPSGSYRPLSATSLTNRYLATLMMNEELTKQLEQFTSEGLSKTACTMGEGTP